MTPSAIGHGPLLNTTSRSLNRTGSAACTRPRPPCSLQPGTVIISRRWDLTATAQQAAGVRLRWQRLTKLKQDLNDAFLAASGSGKLGPPADCAGDPPHRRQGRRERRVHPGRGHLTRRPEHQLVSGRLPVRRPAHRRTRQPPDLKPGWSGPAANRGAVIGVTLFA